MVLPGRRAKDEAWNGQDYYISFGEGPHRNWEDAVQYGYVGGGQGAWYSRSLKQVPSGGRVFVHLPQRGYVGVGTVTQPAVMARDFRVDVDGKSVPLLDLPLHANPGDDRDDPDMAEWIVGVDWIRTLPRDDAIWEPGLFANQNTACKLRNQFTIDRLTLRFALDS